MIFGGKNWMYGVKWSQKEIALRAWEIKADSLFARKNIWHLTPFVFIYLPLTPSKDYTPKIKLSKRNLNI